MPVYWRPAGAGKWRDLDLDPWPMNNDPIDIRWGPHGIALELQNELEVLDYDIERLERRLASTERAPFEWRWTGTAEAWEDMCAGLRARISVLKEERHELAAKLEVEL